MGREMDSHRQQSGAPWGEGPGVMRPVEMRPWEVLVRRRWQLFACLLLVCGVAFATVVMRRPHYEAAARVQLVTDPPQLGGFGSSGPMERDYFTTQVQLLRSRRVLSRAADQLAESGRWNGGDRELARVLEERIQVRPVGNSRLIDVIASADTAQEASAIANEVAAAFSTVSTEARQAMNERLIERVRSEVARYDHEIAQKQASLEAFRREHLVAEPGEGLAEVRTRINKLEAQQTAATVRQMELESRCRQLQGYLSAEGPALLEASGALLSGDATVAAYRAKLRELEEQESRLSRVYLPGHERLREVRLSMADVRTQLGAYARQWVSSELAAGQETRAGLEQQQQELSNLVAQERERAVALAGQRSEYEALAGELTRLEEFRAGCMEKVREFSLREGMSESPVLVVDAARPPEAPAGLQKSHQAASILLLGLLFSTGFVFAWERFSQDRRVAGPVGASASSQGAARPTVPYWPMGGAWQSGATEAAEPAMGSVAAAGASAQPMETVHEAEEASSRVLGVLGNIELGGKSQADAAFRGRCRVVNSDPTSGQAGTLRALASQLLGRFGDSRQSLVVTNILPHSGKTTVASNLAIQLAGTGRRVLLIDANISRPAVHRVFGVGGGHAGLADVLMDAEQLESALVATEEANLTILANAQGGAGSEDASSLHRLAGQLADRFDWVIYDAGAIQQTFTKRLLSVVGKALCVTAGTEEAELSAALSQVELCGAVGVGVVQNLHVGAEEAVTTEAGR